MSQTRDLSQGWTLGWMPEPTLGRWKQRFGDWTVAHGALVGESPDFAQILAYPEPQQDHQWSCRVRIDTPDTAFSVMVCFDEGRNSYYQIRLKPGEQVRANYVLSDGFDGELLPPCGPAIDAEVEYDIAVSVGKDGVRIRLNGEPIGEFSDRRLAGRMAGFMVQHGRATVLEARMTDADTGETIFADDFFSNSLARRVPVELDELESERWIPAVVPGTVHTALLEAGIIEDPYYGYNGPKQKWIDRQRWIYKKEFEIPEEWSGKNVELLFDGIDYHGYIWINGHSLGYHEGMLRPRRFDITAHLRPEGPNELVVCLLPCPSPPHSNVRPYILQRWHFNMDIVTVGLWGTVRLRAFEQITLCDPQVVTRSIEDGKAIVDVAFTLRSYAMYPFDLTGTVEIRPPDGAGEVLSQDFRTGYFNGAQRRRLTFEIPDPQLWWPNGMGEQPLYTLRIDARAVEHHRGDAGHSSDECELRFGIRTLEMRPTPDGRWKYDWIFAVNGRPFFAKGSNWMPIDQMLRLDPEHYNRLLQRAADSHINMLRPWGAGLLETDVFYDACDRLGICVWQEFPLANGFFHKMDRDVWHDTIVQNVTRLRNRPSLVMWCGGNEFDPDCVQNKPVVDLLENLCHELDPSRPFHRACPYGGDSHSYQVNWMEGGNYTYFTRDRSAAVTEFSMASPPHLETLRKVLPESEFDSFPPKGPDPLEDFPWQGWDPSFREQESAFSMHDAHLSRALKVMMPFFSDNGIPANWEEFVEFAQASHGTLTQFGIDFWRSRWPYCTGAMSWVFNVIWPSSMTWEYVDWFGTPKASYYDQKRAYEPLHVGAVFDELFTEPGTDFCARLFVANDTAHNYSNLSVRVALYDLELHRLAAHRTRVTVPADRAAPAGRFVWHVPSSSAPQVLFLCVDLRDEDEQTLLSRSTYTPRVGTPVMRMPYIEHGPWISDVRRVPTLLDARWDEPWHRHSDGWRAFLAVSNRGEVPAYRVRARCPEHDHRLRYSDNYFWLDPGETRVLEIRHESGPVEAIRVSAWNAPDREPAALHLPDSVRLEPTGAGAGRS